MRLRCCAQVPLVLAGVPANLTVSAALRGCIPGRPLLGVLAMAFGATRITRPAPIGGTTVAETLKLHSPHVVVGLVALAAVGFVAVLTDDILRSVLRTRAIGRVKAE